MSMSPDLKASFEAVVQHYQAELKSIQQQLVPLQARQKELHHSINTLSKSLTPDTSFPPSPLLFHSRPQNLKYANLSVRWAILDLLSDAGAMATAEIVEALKARGVESNAKDFTNNVSAVLSTTMKLKHNEVQQLPDGKWQLNDNGIQAITHIRTTPKFRRSCA